LAEPLGDCTEKASREEEGGDLHNQLQHLIVGCGAEYLQNRNSS
jgi:hypothetical protein